MAQKKKNRLPKELTTVTPLSRFLAIILFISLPFIGFYLGNIYSKKHNMNILEPTIESNINGWNTYHSSKANYSFQYPPEWPLVNIPPARNCDGCIEEIHFTTNYIPNTLDNGIAVILISKDDRIKTLQDYKNIFIESSDKVDVEETTVGNEKATSYKLSGGIEPLPIIEYIVVKNDLYFQIRLDNTTETNNDRERNLRLFNEMLTTFTF